MRITPTYGVVLSIQRANVWKVPTPVTLLIESAAAAFASADPFQPVDRDRYLLVSLPPHQNHLQWFSLLEWETCKCLSSNVQKNCHLKYKGLFFILLYVFCKTMIVPL